MTTPIYNQIGLTIDALTASGTDASTAALIQRSGGTTGVIVLASSTDNGAKLPADAAIGDVVEVYPNSSSSSNIIVYAPEGDDICGTSSRVVGSSGITAWFRKITSTSWAIH